MGKNIIIAAFIFIVLFTSELSACGTETETSFADAMLAGFSNIISPVDGDRCPMYPSCSSYSKKAFKKHGIFLGWIMTCDRLVRCGGDEMKISEKVYLKKEPHCYDPVENNDFWWESQRKNLK